MVNGMVSKYLDKSASTASVYPLVERALHDFDRIERTLPRAITKRIRRQVRLQNRFNLKVVHVPENARFSNKTPQSTAGFGFNVMWRRYTGQWWPIYFSLTLEEALAALETDGVLRPPV